MTNDNTNVFSFYLDESLWFERGQEVNELMGISLDPEIVIHPLDETVLIQGAINLTGEYFAKSDEDSEAETVAPFPSRKLVERVEQEEEGASQFYHQFPVEVSIPRNRVENVDDVSVSIDVFDYELPSANQLKLHATIAIHGIEEADREKEESASSKVRSENNTPWEQSSQFEVDYPENDEVLTSPEENTLSLEQESSVIEEEAVESKSESSSGDRWKYKKVQTLSEFFNHGSAPEVEENEPSPSPSYEASPSLEYMEDEMEVQDDEGEADAESRNIGNQLLFSMFEDREETYTKMKMCIVQEEDTLESIADRYQISITNLTKVNNVFEDDLKPGKIIYIPSQS